MSWQTILDNIQSELAGGSALTSEYEIGGVRRRFQSLKEAKEFIQFMEQKGSEESSTVKIGRGYARNVRL